MEFSLSDSQFLRKTIWEEVGITSEKAMAPHSSTFAWKIPWTEKPGGL